MNVNLTPQLEEMVRQKVTSRMYTSASEVVREALRLMDEQDRLRSAKLESLRQDIRAGLDSGPSKAWDPAEIKRAARAKRASKAPASKAWDGRRRGSRRCCLPEVATRRQRFGCI